MLPFNVWAQSLWETLYMVILSTAISYLIGLPLMTYLPKQRFFSEFVDKHS